MSNWPIRNAPNTCFCSHDITMHGTQPPNNPIALNSKSSISIRLGLNVPLLAGYNNARIGFGDEVNNGYDLLINASGNFIIRKLVAGVFTNLIIGSPIIDGLPHIYTFTVTPTAASINNLFGYQDGKLLVSVTGDTSLNLTTGSWPPVYAGAAVVNTTLLNCLLCDTHPFDPIGNILDTPVTLSRNP